MEDEERSAVLTVAASVMIVSDEESPIIAECLNIFRMPCLCVIWDRKLDLSQIIHDIETEEGMHVSLL